VVTFDETPRAHRRGFTFLGFNFPRFQEWNTVFTRIRKNMSILFLGFRGADNADDEKYEAERPANHGNRRECFSICLALFDLLFA
jgi:hypothetical protein